MTKENVKEEVSSLEAEVKKTATKKANVWKKLDGEGKLSESLKKAGMTEAHFDHMSQQQIENIAVGGSFMEENIESLEVEGFSDALTGSLDALLNIGIGFKLPEVKPRDPDNIHFFWASIAQNAVYPVEKFLATKAVAYATANDLDGGFASVAHISSDVDRIRIEEMVLLKTTRKHWEAAMTKFHHNLPAQSQSEIYSKNKSLPTPLEYEEESDAVFNPNKNSSLYGAAQAVGAPRAGGWGKYLTNY